MPYIILALGILIGLYAAYRFFLSANVHQVKAFFLTAAALALCLALFYLAVTGRLIAALALIVGLMPLGISHLREKRRRRGDIIDVAPIEDEEKPDDPS